jgi:hypothetical protein
VYFNEDCGVLHLFQPKIRITTKALASTCQGFRIFKNKAAVLNEKE